MEEHTLKMFENKLLRRAFGPMREKLTGRIKMYNEEFQNLYFSPNIISLMKSSSMKLVMHAAHMGIIANACTDLIGKFMWKGPLGWEYNIKTGLTDVYCDGVGSVHVTQNKGTWQTVVNAVMNPWELLEYLSDCQLLKKDSGP
jgi:hypothetical protein